MTGRCCDDASCRSAARTAPQPREWSQVTVPATRARALRTAAGLESALHGGECRGRRGVSRGGPPPPPRGRPARFCFTGMTCGFPARREPALTGRLSGSTLWESALLPAFHISAEERPPFLHRPPGTFPALPAGRRRTAPARPRRPVRRAFEASVSDSPTETRTYAGGSEPPQNAHRASAQQGGPGTGVTASPPYPDGTGYRAGGETRDDAGPVHAKPPQTPSARHLQYRSALYCKWHG